MRFPDVVLDRPVATVMLLVCLVVLGTVAVTQLPLDLIPVVVEPEVDVSVPFPGSHPLEALRQVVRPIEEEVATIPNAKAIFGFVREGSVEVEVQFDWAADVEIAKLEVRDAVERARPRLPAGIGHIRVEADTDGPGAEILNGRISAERDLSESWDLLDRRIRQPLERIRGVASVDLYGVESQEIRIDLDFASLERHGVTVDELVRRIDAANLDMDLGSIEGDLVTFDVRSAARFRDVGGLRDLPLGQRGLRLRDVALVELREPILDYGRHLDRNFAIGFDINKEPTANTVDTVTRLMVRIDEIRSDPELEGITVLVWDNSAEVILRSIEGLRDAGVFGGLLAVAVLFVFLRRLSTTLIVAVAIPFSLLVTCGAMFLAGRSFNVLTMLGLMLGVGMLVDNGVVVIENIHRLQGEGLGPREAARRGARQVALAVCAATATTIIVWSWLLVTERNTMTIYIGEVALVICMAVTCSLVISLAFIPLAAARAAPPKTEGQGVFVRRLVPRYRHLLAWTLRHRFATLLALALLASSAAVPFSLLEKTDLPQEQRRDVLIDYQVHDPSTKDVLESHVNQVEDWLDTRRDDLGFEHVYSYYGREWGAGTRVYLPRDEASEAAIAALGEALRVGLPVIPGVDLEIGGDHRGRHRGPRRAGVVRVAFHGEDPDYLERVAIGAEERFRGLPHLKEIYGPSLVGSREVRVRVDAERAHSLGIAPRRVADAVRFAFRGSRLRRYQGARSEIDIVVSLPEEAQPGLSALEDLVLPTPEGDTVRLGAVADIEMARTPPTLRREDRRTTMFVTLEFDDKAIQTAEAQAAVGRRLQTLELPEGYSWDWGRERHREDEGLALMFRGILLSMVAVVLLMAALFESFSQPLAILVTLPLALFGALWSLWAFGLTFNVLAVIGIIILIGIVVNNGIVMVDHINSLRREGAGRIHALIRGCGDRLRPVLMTAITTVFGLIPLAMSDFAVAGVYNIRSMVVAMIGGLASSTVFTLVALPVWYATIEDLGALLAGLLPTPSSWGRSPGVET